MKLKIDSNIKCICIFYIIEVCQIFTCKVYCCDIKYNYTTHENAHTRINVKSLRLTKYSFTIEFGKLNLLLLIIFSTPNISIFVSLHLQCSLLISACSFLNI